MANITFCCPSPVEFMGAEELPPGVSKAAFEAGIENFNRAIDVLNQKSSGLVALLQYVSKNKDKIIQGAHQLNEKYPYNTNVGTEVGYWIKNIHGSYADFIKNKLAQTRIPYLSHAYKNLKAELANLKTGYGGAVSAALFGSGPVESHYYIKYPEAYKSEWFQTLSSSIFGTHGFLGKARTLVEELIYAIEKMAIDGDVTWPRSLDLPALNRIKKAQDVVKVVEAQQQKQRQVIGIDLGRPDMPIVIPKFTFPTVVQDNKPGWLMPAIIGGGVLMTALALKG